MPGQMRILDTAQIALREVDQKMRCKLSIAMGAICRVKNSARVVASDSFTQVVCQASVESVLVVLTLQNIDVEKLSHAARWLAES